MVIEQIFESVEQVGLPIDWAEGILETVNSEAASFRNSQVKAESDFRSAIADCESRLDALLDMALSKAITQADYSSKREDLINQKIAFREKLAVSQSNSLKRFEPLTEFVKVAKQARLWAIDGNIEGCRDFLQENGSNLVLRDKRVRIEWKNPWKHVAESRVQSSTLSPNSSETIQMPCWLRDLESNQDTGLQRLMSYR